MNEMSSFLTNIQTMYKYILIISNTVYILVRGVEKKYYRFMLEDVKKRY